MKRQDKIDWHSDEGMPRTKDVALSRGVTGDPPEIKESPTKESRRALRKGHDKDEKRRLESRRGPRPARI